MPDVVIDYLPSLFGAAIQFYSCFISYSSRDEEFVHQIHNDLQNNGVRCWFAPEDMKIGERIRSSIDNAIRLTEKLLLVLSRHSIESSWVEKEVETALELEHKQQKLILFPVTIDDTVLNTHCAWANDIRRTRHIGDFRDWRVEEKYRGSTVRLLRDLKIGQ